MSRLDKLIKSLCPDGVNYAFLGDILDYEQPTKYLVSSTNYNDRHSTPVLTAGKTFILGRTDETTGVYPASTKNPVLIFDDFTTAFHWVDFPFKAKSSAMKMLQPRNDAPVDFRYIYHAMRCVNFQPSEHARHWISQYSQFRIPMPPLDVQREIARILDKFSALEAELKAELEARRRQFEVYRNLLISEASDSAPLVKLSEVLQYEQPTKYLVLSTDYNDAHPTPVLTAGKTFVLGHTDETSGIYPASTDNPVIIFDDFTTAFHWVDFPFKAKSSAMKMLKPRREVSADFRYVYYAMSCVNFQPSQHTRHWISQYSEFEIPLPDMAVQLEIVRALDALSALVEDASSGLPAEISFRRKQYEYYREQLLTFKELKS